MNQLSAKDALEKLKAQIMEGIKETKEVILHAANKGDYALAADLDSQVEGRQSVVYMIDEMLDGLDEPKTPRQ